jgi:hypothetical protein
MDDHGLSKDAALSELQARTALGRQLLARPAGTDAELEALTAARIEWQLANKKLLHQIFGDAAGQVRFPHAVHDDARPLRPRFEDRVREFQELMIDGLADLERLIQALKRMA